MKNLELKFKVIDFEASKRVCKQIGAGYSGVLRQKDTFFRVNGNRLKLRNINSRKFELIYYSRSDSKNARESNYEIIPLKAEAPMLSILKHSLGLRGTVIKKRALYLWQNTRIHLDEVKHLGKFMEFEIVCTSSLQTKNAPQQMKKLIEWFGVKKSQLISKSYIDLLERKRKKTGVHK